MRMMPHILISCEVIILKNKSRKQKQVEYDSKYGDIPLDLDDRLVYIIEQKHISDKQLDEILLKRDTMLNNLFFYECKIQQLFEEPEGSCRPRFRVLTKSNFNRQAIGSSFVHVYTPHAAEDHRYMKQLCDEELFQLDHLINTPCICRYDAFYKTPSSYNGSDTILAEIGLIRPPIQKPDWDNLGKKYCDMYNHNVWLDDALVFDGEVHKYYSILPRIEITLKYLNTVYTKQQYRQIINRKDYDGSPISYLDRFGRIVDQNGQSE